MDLFDKEQDYLNELLYTYIYTYINTTNNGFS